MNTVCVCGSLATLVFSSCLPRVCFRVLSFSFSVVGHAWEDSPCWLGESRVVDGRTSCGRAECLCSYLTAGAVNAGAVGMLGYAWQALPACLSGVALASFRLAV